MDDLGCSVQLVPVIPNRFTTSSISSFIAGNGTLMVLDSVTNEYGVGRVHKKSGNLERQTSGRGECRVESLEVIRGRMQATQIDHSGFSVVANSMEITIRVSTCMPYTYSYIHRILTRWSLITLHTIGQIMMGKCSI